MSQSESISVFKCTSWLNKFLNHRGLKNPDSRPLYEYHATSDEYHELKRLLCGLGKVDGLRFDKGYAACFTLFCSEWYRRDYERNCGWAWEPINESLGIALTHSQLSNIVPKGLEEYWKRPLRFYDSERRNFLGSLFSEGGLPFRVLKEADNRFKSVFSRILSQYDASQASSISVLTLTEAVVEKSQLPVVFKDETSVELISSMAEQLSSLVQTYGLSNHSEPVKELDRVNSKWRNSFPIPLDDETGTHLINGLLSTASIETKPKIRQKKTLSCQSFWSDLHPNEIQTAISLPEELVFTLSGIPPTTRFELSIYEDGEEVASLGPAYATLKGMQATVRLRRTSARFVRQKPAASLSVVARAGGMTVGSKMLEGGEIAIGEVPLTFTLQDGFWLLQGQSSCSVRDSHVLVVVPENARVTSENQGSPFTTKVMNYPVWAFEGHLDIIIEGDEAYRIRTGREQTNQHDFYFKGKRLSWECYPNETYLGLPQLTQTTHEPKAPGNKRFFSGKMLDECNAQETMGAQFISVRNEKNETLFRRKIGILPEDFQIEIKGGAHASEGTFIISTKHNCLYILDKEAFNVDRFKENGKTILKVKAQGVPPPFIQLQVKPNLSADAINLVLPFPAVGCLVFNADGKPLPDNITINDLLGSRAFLCGKNGEPKRFKLELRLRSRSGPPVWHEWTYTTGERPVEINLYSLREHIENLLSLETGIDQTVDMRISGAGSTSSWQIRRYKYRLHFDPDRQLLLADAIGNRNESAPSPVIMLLSEPERKAAPLTSRMSEGVPIGEFELSSAIEKNGPWLVIPKPGEAASFRPYFIHGEPHLQSADNNIRSLQKATQLFDPRSETNTINIVLDQMADDPAHSGWQFLRNLYEQFGYLPLATFEVWRALLNHPQALVMSLFKFEMSADYLNRIESEFPVFWEFLPINEIKKAADKFKEFLMHKGASEEMQTRVLNTRFQQLGIIFPTYANEVENWLCRGELPPTLPPVLMKSIIQGWYQALMQEHSESRWPEYGGRRLHEWILSQDDPVIEIPADTPHRYSTVWLPVFAAAVASGNTTFESVFGNKSGAVFFLRQVRDFDSRWFNSIFQYCLLRNVVKNQKEQK
ncbi:TPA: hypothetical protein QDZ66_004693 [Pluralibacter gergoviae]|uniref:Uncharacterized protein n=1 Tax=Pluralibacter gergoviae TaxID=61647 RepID=A0A0J5L0I3_PLUGE|nr:STY4851/ECs_5259 family protein [Pluralibacter gergoviae]KMK11834.1 hypothetical protein ABW06_19545 [Pluralibacter gergoviae]KMK24778.1 hypothetical protein ABW10_08800 [Pluralibacter gergoviae]MBL3691553.1 hypothetical protein [Pluralibacter gergoviae]HDS1153856.1 hypothetical protein [Pluralibacter gergoviae]